MTKTKGGIIAAVLLMSVTSFAQDAPHLISRLAVVAPDRAPAYRGASLTMVTNGCSCRLLRPNRQGRGDSCDVIYAGAAAFETTFVMVHHYLHGRRRKNETFGNRLAAR
jgi:hypothetical protein